MQRQGVASQYGGSTNGAFFKITPTFRESGGNSVTVLALLPLIVSSLLIAAHFYRAGSWYLAAICLIIQLLLMCRQRIVPRLFTLFLLMSALEWLRTLYILIVRYQEAGAPSHRLTIILTGVSLFTGLSTLTFKTAVLKRRFRQAADTSTILPDTQ